MAKAQFESLEQRMLMSAASTVVIGGQRFNAIEHEGFQLLIPKKMPTVKPALLTSGVFGSKSSISSLIAKAQASPTGFQITLNLTGTVSSAVQTAFNNAVSAWESIITADVPDVAGIDDIQIDATVKAIDGVGKILGQAGPSAARGGSFIPSKGVMQFDSADLTNLANSGQLADVIFHEMGHVLGIGTIWGLKKLVTTSTTDPRYTGVAAITAYKGLGGKDATIPVENTGGAGTAGAHWRESVFTNEVMTGYLNSGQNLVSTITIASMIDLGYSVDMSAAEPYNIPGVTPVTDIPNLTGSISGKAFADRNNNGVQDDGESGAAGRVVYIDANRNSIPDPGERFAVTSDTGAYAFGNIADGSYSIKVSTTSSFEVITGTTTNVVISGGEQVTTAHLGLFDSKSSISGVVFVDNNNNGEKDSGEAAVFKGTVFVDTNNNGVVDKGELSTLTSATGAFKFDNLKAGTFNLKLLRDAGVNQTGVTSALTLAAGENTLATNIGSYDTRGVIAGTLFLDSDNDATRDDGELVLAKTIVFLDANGNNALDRNERATVTGTDGAFRFTSVLPGSYTVRATLAAGVNQSTSTSVTLAAAGAATGLAVGAFDTKGAITGVAFNDTNNNGTRNDGETPIAKATVFLDTNSNGLQDTTERAVIAGLDGTYRFDALLPGTYKPRVKLATGVNATTAPTVTLSAAGNVTGTNLGGYDTRASVTGFAFVDTNNNGVRNDGELPAAKATVYLDTNANGRIDKGEPSTISATDGTYLFSNLMPGEYRVRIVVAGLVVQTSPTGTTTLSTAQKLTGLNVGTFDAAVSISGAVYNDKNLSGTRDTGETGSANRIVFIDTNGNGLPDRTELATKTSVTGEYTFAGLPAGTYAVRVILPAGVNLVTPTNNAALSVTVAAGQRSTGNTLGIDDTNGSLVGSIFFDANRNAVKEVQEAAISKGNVYLDLNNNARYDTNEPITTSATNGVFGFAAVPKGDYTVRVITPARMVQSLPASDGGRQVTIQAGQTSVVPVFGLALASTPAPLKSGALTASVAKTSSLKLSAFGGEETDSLKLFSSTRVAA